MRLYALSACVEAPTTRFNGVVHSIFHHACNVRLEPNALLTLVSSEKGNAPHGIRLGTPPGFTFLNRLRVGQPVACRGGVLRINGSELSVDLRTANPWHVNLDALRIDLHQYPQAQAWALAWFELETHRCKVGWPAMMEGPSCAARDSVTSATRTMLGRRGGQAVPLLLEATRNLKCDAAAAAIEPLIGLGSGLTPSGDDFLVGYLAGLRSTAGGEVLRERFLAAIGAWLSTATGRTNAISAAYLDSAARGNVSEPIATLAQQLAHAQAPDDVRVATRAALSVGYTSGADGVLGLLLGCLPWAAPSLSFLQGQPDLRFIGRYAQQVNAWDARPNAALHLQTGKETPFLAGIDQLIVYS